MKQYGCKEKGKVRNWRLKINVYRRALGHRRANQFG